MTTPSPQGVSDTPCPVCMLKPRVSVTLECTHTFCYDCITKWTQKHNNTCPLCRATNALPRHSAGAQVEEIERLEDRIRRLKADLRYTNQMLTAWIDSCDCPCAPTSLSP